MRSLDRLLDRLIPILLIYAGAVMLLMMLHVVADAVATNIFRSPIHGTLAIVSAYYMVPLVFLPLALVERRGEHFQMDFFTQRFPGELRRGLKLVAQAWSAVLLVAITWATAESAWRESVAGEAWQTAVGLIDVWPSRWAVPAGCGVMALATISEVVRTLMRRPPREQADS